MGGTAPVPPRPIPPGALSTGFNWLARLAGKRHASSARIARTVAVVVSRIGCVRRRLIELRRSQFPGRRRGQDPRPNEDHRFHPLPHHQPQHIHRLRGRAAIRTPISLVRCSRGKQPHRKSRTAASNSATPAKPSNTIMSWPAGGLRQDLGCNGCGQIEQGLGSIPRNRRFH